MNSQKGSVRTFIIGAMRAGSHAAREPLLDARRLTLISLQNPMVCGMCSSRRSERK